MWPPFAGACVVGVWDVDRTHPPRAPITSQFLCVRRACGRSCALLLSPSLAAAVVRFALAFPGRSGATEEHNNTYLLVCACGWREPRAPCMSAASLPVLAGWGYVTNWSAAELAVLLQHAV